MESDTGLTGLLKRHALWLRFLVILVPLLVLLALQYWWLVELQRAAAMPDRSSLDHFLEAVVAEVTTFYGATAESALDVPARIVSSGRLDQSAVHFRRQRLEGARAVFLLRFDADQGDRLVFYDMKRRVVTPARPSPEARAVTVAAAPWRLIATNGVEFDSPRLVVEERDPDNRIILYPVVNQASRVVGVAGMILDDFYFHDVILPEAIETTGERIFTGRLDDSVIVTVEDHEGRLAYASEPRSSETEESRKAFSFVYTDWTLGVQPRHLPAGQWAHSNFPFNLGLSLLTAAVLVGGIVLALRAASREMRLSRMKSDFVSNVSHELRTPLASIRVFGEFLKHGRVTGPEQVREYGDYIEAESRRLTNLINNLLDVARIESGRRTYEFRRGDVGEVMSGIVRVMRVRLEKMGFTLSYQRPRALPPARIDADALGQAFHNLLDNAVIYSGDARAIRASVEATNGEIVASVSDSGIGIPRAERDRIFERFHRVGGAGRDGALGPEDVRGSGLGLTIVGHVVSAHGGRVTVDSTPGEGSTFSIHLPVDESPEEGAVT